MPSIEMLPYLLKELRLPAITQHWMSRCKEAEKNHWSYGAFLADLLDLELTLREQRRMERAHKASKLPAGKTLSNFDFSTVKTINPMQIQNLAEDKKWIEDTQNLVLFGPSGVGKTHLAAAIGYGLLPLGVSVLFSTTTHIVQMLQQAKAELKIKAALERLNKFKVIILDDIGYVRKTEQETSVLFELIAHRYETGSLIITANQPFNEWENIFPDKVMAVAAVDRIVHHATIINIQEESFRAKQAKINNQKI